MHRSTAATIRGVLFRSRPELGTTCQIGSLLCTIYLFTNLLDQDTNLQENQNQSPQEPPKEGTDAKVPQNTLSATEQTPRSTSPDIKTKTPIEVTQAQTSHIEPQTQLMEVHKHPHHVMHKKKWNEYLLEFFMLFLAVFLGFVAENIRERIAEHEREERFANRLLLDLKQDTAVFQKNIQEFRERQKSQAYLFRTVSGTKKATDSTIVSSFFAVLRFWNPRFTTATYNQMKMSGGLRYIRNDDLTNELQQYYDVFLPEIDREVMDVRKVFTDRIVPYMITHFRFQDLVDSIPPKYILLNRSNESDQELINIMGVYGGGWDAVFDLHQRYLKHAEKLIEMIEQDYHLK